MEAAKRLSLVNEYYFSRKLREIDEMNKRGEDVINLGIGSPDLPPNTEVIKALQDVSAYPDVHSYQGYRGIKELREAIGHWYQNSYKTVLNADTEVLPLMGSKEGIMHVSMSFLNEGDAALLPNPGYPTYRSATELAGGVCLDYLLEEDKNWLPDFDVLEKEVERFNSIEKGKVKLMWVNYPHMPTGAKGSMELFEKLIEFGRKYKILICHDNPYSFILNDHPESILQVEGGKETAIELNSLSKSHNMAGWRVGMVCGRKDIIDTIVRFKSNMDSGMFLPVQKAAVRALMLDNDWYQELSIIYRRRRAIVFQLLKELNCSFSREQAGMFVWARIPENYIDGNEMSDRILNKAKVFITPGSVFGTAGEKYVRVSLCNKEAILEAATMKVRQMIEQNQLTV